MHVTHIFNLVFLVSSKMYLCVNYITRMLFICIRWYICVGMYPCVPSVISASVCSSYVTRMFLVCYSYVTRMLLVCYSEYSWGVLLGIRLAVSH